jgi:hypothetical protein
MPVSGAGLAWGTAQHCRQVCGELLTGPHKACRLGWQLFGSCCQTAQHIPEATSGKVQSTCYWLVDVCELSVFRDAYNALHQHQPAYNRHFAPCHLLPQGCAVLLAAGQASAEASLPCSCGSVRLPNYK